MNSFDDSFSGLFDLAYRVAFRILGRRDDAADVAQETLARAERRWSRLAQPYGWVAKVAANEAIGVWRKRQRQDTAGPGDVAGADGAGAAAHDPPPDELAAERTDLVRALRGLPRRQREVVILRYLADRPEAEVAQALRCSPGSVKTHASRGLAALRTELEGV